MNYEEKYKDALDNFKKIKASNKDNKELVDFIEYKYPELKESEDERIRKDIIAYMRYERKSTEEEIENRFIPWLEKQGVQKPAWSEEDDYAVERLFCLLDNEQDNYPQLSCDFQEIEEIKEWLKSFKERYSWKPSDEQMMELTTVARGFPTSNAKVLQSLYNDLKKLREE